MSEEIDKHVLRKYEIQQKLGKGVRPIRLEQSAQREQPSSESRRKLTTILLTCRRMASCGKPWIRKLETPSR
jgi:hypothetical protein